MGEDAEDPPLKVEEPLDEEGGQDDPAVTQDLARPLTCLNLARTILFRLAITQLNPARRLWWFDPR